MEFGAQIDLDAKLIRLAPAKTKRRGKPPLEIPILPDLMAALLETPTTMRRGPVLPSIAARKAVEKAVPRL